MLAFILLALILSSLVTEANKTSSLALAQGTTQEKLSEIKRADEEVREKLQKSETITKKVKKIIFEYGGWLSSYFWRYEDKDSRKDNTLTRNIYYQTMRLWTKATILEKHLIYLRIKNSYISVRDTAAQYHGIRDDYDGPHVELAYINASLSKPINLILGRQNFYLGKGIVYNRIHDGVQIVASYPSVNLKAFSAKTKPHEHHLDFSLPSYDKRGWQFFNGFELALAKNKNFIPYIYFLSEKDHPKEEPEDTTQDYNYDARYHGIGIKGTSPQNFLWSFEVIKELGKSFTDSYSTDPQKKNIDAWASVISAKYSFQCNTHPAVDFEYAWGQGDKDRQSTTNTAAGGNINGDDHNFQYFGYYFNGYRLDTRLSNIHIYKLGFSFAPLEKLKLGKNTLIGTKFFVFRKDKKQAAIYEDTPASESNRDIGKEADFYLYWLINPQLTLAIRYGVFLPGEAYPEDVNASSQYFNTYLTYQF